MIEKVERPATGDRRVIRDVKTYQALLETLNTNEAILVPFDTDSNTARSFRARFWRDNLRLRVWKMPDGTHAAWLEDIGRESVERPKDDVEREVTA